MYGVAFDIEKIEWHFTVHVSTNQLNDIFHCQCTSHWHPSYAKNLGVYCVGLRLYVNKTGEKNVAFAVGFNS